MPKMLLLEEIISIPAAEPQSPATERVKNEVLSPQLPYRSHICNAAVDDEKLTKFTSTHRPRLHKLPPHTTSGPLSSSTAAISSPFTTNNSNISQDVHSKPLNSVSSRSPSVPNNAALSTTPFESPIQTFHSSLSHGSINSSPASLRTPVFHNHEQLVAFCQLPTQLPPPPRVHRSSIPDPLTRFEQLKNNYLKMLSKTPTDTSSSAPNTMPSAKEDSVLMPPPAAEQASQLPSRDVMESPFSDFFPSPEFPSGDFLTSPNFMTSPMDDSPFPDYLNTPMMPDMDYFDTSPIIPADDFPALDFGPSLFPEYAGWPQLPTDTAPAPKSEVKKTQVEVKEQLVTPLLDDLYTISPEIVDSPSNFDASPEMPNGRRNHKPISTRTKPGPTGTRKNITPDSLVSVDAPIQSRNYQTPSATSRKEVPAVFIRKRVRSQAFDDEEELADLPPNATEKEQIEHKRRQNTLAARKSRKRKLEHQLYLEEKVEQQEREIERWRTRAITYQKMLVQHGVSVPAFDD